MLRFIRRFPFPLRCGSYSKTMAFLPAVYPAGSGHSLPCLGYQVDPVLRICEGGWAACGIAGAGANALACGNAVPTLGPARAPVYSPALRALYRDALRLAAAERAVGFDIPGPGAAVVPECAGRQPVSARLE